MNNFNLTGQSFADFQMSRPSTCQSNSSAFSRLEQATSIRRGRSLTEMKATGNLGPGSYDTTSSFRPHSSMGVKKSTGGMSKSNVAQQFSIIKVEQAPPVGTYNLPRIMTPGTPGSDIGIQISSPFRSSGRGSILHDGVHYNTLREDISLSNMGPGYYNQPDLWAPSSFVKYNKQIRAGTVTTKAFNGEVTAMNTMNPNRKPGLHDKLWQQKGGVAGDRERERRRQCELNPFDTSEADAKMLQRHHHKEVAKDVDSVRQLPNYYK